MFDQWQWLLGLSLGLGTKSARLSILISKMGIPPKCWHFEDDCVPNGSSDKIAAWGGGSSLFMKYDVFRQSADFFKEWS